MNDVVAPAVSAVLAAARQGEGPFLAQFTSCALLVLQDTSSPPPSRDEIRGTTLRIALGSGGAGGKVQNVVFVVRSGRQPYPMVTVGRNGANDIIFASPSVSKLHASFSQDAEGRWCITDSGSSNGTIVAGSRLDPGVTTTISSGDTVLFGAVAAVFMDPRGLLGWATRELAR